MKQYAFAAGFALMAATAQATEEDSQWINAWGGGTKYLAEWQINNNYIDNSSVCGNHKKGSINYRECRKAAKQFFKEQCKGWTERAEENRKEWSFKMKARYCSAASNFNPAS